MFKNCYKKIFTRLSSSEVSPIKILDQYDETFVPDFGFKKINIFHLKEDELIKEENSNMLIDRLCRATSKTIIKEIFPLLIDNQHKIKYISRKNDINNIIINRNKDGTFLYRYQIIIDFMIISIHLVFHIIILFLME